MIADGVAWMVGELTEHAGTSCTYHRGGQSDSVTMVRSPQPTQALEIDGRVIEWQPVDFKIKTSLLPFGEPQRGDQIRCTVNGDVLVHEVHMPGNSPPFRDLSGVMTRIHTKVIQ